MPPSHEGVARLTVIFSTPIATLLMVGGSGTEIDGFSVVFTVNVNIVFGILTDRRLTVNTTPLPRSGTFAAGNTKVDVFAVA